MIKIITIFLAILLNLALYSQNVGIGINNPISKLEIDGEIKIGMNSNAPSSGMIRFNPSTISFEGFNGNRWLRLSYSSSNWGIPEVFESKAINNPTTEIYSQFGSKVAIYGDFAIVSAMGQDTLNIAQAGVVYVYKKLNENWVAYDTIISPDVINYSNFGHSIDISQNRIVVSASSSNSGQNGKVFTYIKNGTNWVYENSILINSSEIKIDGDLLAVGDPGNGYYGKVHIFNNNNGSWTQLFEIDSPIQFPSGLFGKSVDMKDNKLIVGASYMNKAFIYELQNPISLKAILVPQDTINSEAFGSSVSINGINAVVGAPSFHQGQFQNMGAAYCYSLIDTLWELEKVVTPDKREGYCWFGESVDICDNYALVGSRFFDTEGNFNQGKAYLYSIQNNWNLVNSLLSSDGISNDEFGTDVSISDETILIGAPNKTVNNIPNIGKIYFYYKK